VFAECPGYDCGGISTASRDAPMLRAALCRWQIYEARRQSSFATSARLGD
jgi:hypothetical protein